VARGERGGSKKGGSRVEKSSVTTMSHTSYRPIVIDIQDDVHPHWYGELHRWGKKTRRLNEPI
jgi:ribosomal protein L31